MRYAAVDVGTNTVRLLVADVDGGSLVPLVRELEVTRLGQGVDADRRLREDAIARTVAVVARYVERARREGAAGVRVAGTSALRDAANPDDFADAVEDATGLAVDVLAGEDEGRICFLGATAGLPGGPFLVCDIGGGSTEFVRGLRHVESVWSADVGSVRLKERYLTSDPPTQGEIRGALTLVEHELLQVERDVGLVGDELLVGVAGTVTQLAALVLGLERYDAERVHGARLSAAAVHDLTERLLAMRVEDVRRLPAVHPGRADVLASGAVLLDAVMQRWALGEVLVSEQDVLDGLVWELVLGPDAGLPQVPGLADSGRPVR